MNNCQINLEDLEAEILPVEELHFEPVERNYRTVQIIFTGLLYLILALSVLFLLLLENKLWFILAESLVFVALVVNLIIVRKAWLFKGYALREFDISYRKGVIFPTVTTIPFNRMQQVSVKQNLVSKIFNLYSVEVVNGAQAVYSLNIPGLTQERANQIKSIVIEKMKHDQE